MLASDYTDNDNCVEIDRSDFTGSRYTGGDNERNGEKKKEERRAVLPPIRVG